MFIVCDALGSSVAGLAAHTCQSCCTHHCSSHGPLSELILVCALQKDISKVREVFDDFLAKYPLCYGYWMQYVGAEVSSGDKCADVLERGVAATPYSIELWLYYIDRLRKGDASVDDVRKCAPAHTVACMRCRQACTADALLPQCGSIAAMSVACLTPSHTSTCRLFSRAAQYVSIDWNAHRLLDKWLEYESSQQDIRHMADIYMMAIALPMKELQRMYASFTDFASQHALSAMVSQEAIDAATLEVRPTLCLPSSSPTCSTVIAAHDTVCSLLVCAHVLVLHELR